MALKAGTEKADLGMAKDIYDQMLITLGPGIESLKEDNTKLIKANWQQLSFVIATGVIKHLQENLEIIDIKTKGDVNISMKGNTAPGGIDQHTHSINLTTQNVVFTQSEDGIGHLKKA